MSLRDAVAAEIPIWKKRITRLIKDYGPVLISEVSVEQIYGGNRGVHAVVSEISKIDTQQGIRLRGYTIPEVLELLPRQPGDEMPLMGGLYYLLMVGHMPDLEDAKMVEAEWQKRSTVPDYVYNVLHSLPSNTHPMTMFSQAILSLQCDSVFARRYNQGMPKSEYWEATLEDALDLTAKLPALAAIIYNMRYREGNGWRPEPQTLDWSANFATMLGKGAEKDYIELCRLFFVLHSDHEGANVAAHTTHLVNSTLADLYHSCSAGMNGLAGPLHGLANQECLRWLLDVRAHFDTFPTREQLEEFAWQTIQSGKVIPGYGHAVLRTTDPRFTAQLEFGRKHCPDDELLRLVELVFEVVPGVLTKTGKVKNPWPNVDAINGTLQYHYGVREFDFYTVLFGVSRILGTTAQNVWARALGFPIERPYSLTTRNIEEIVTAKVAAH